MSRNRAVALAVVALLTMGAAAGPRAPVARVLQVKGKATLIEDESFQRPAAVYGTIYADERLAVAKGAQVTLVFRSDGHVERVGSGTVKVTQDGCQPRTSIQQVAMSEQNRAVVGKLARGPRGIVQGGVVMARAPAPRPKDVAPSPGASPEPQASEPPVIVATGQICPIIGSTVLVDKPIFSWPAAPKAERYTLTLYFLGNRIWSARSETIRLEYSGDTPLKPGALYSWEITTTIDGKPASVCEGMFRVASQRQRDDAAALAKVLEKPEPELLALAAMWYRQNELLSEAIAVNEQLAKLAPDADIYRELAELYLQVDRQKEADAAEDHAAELERKAEGGGRKAER